MSTDDDLRTGLRSLLDNLDSEVSLPKRNRRETTMHLAMRLDPSFKPTASTLRGRARQAGQRLIEIYAAREAELTSPDSVGNSTSPDSQGVSTSDRPASDEEITAD